MAWYRCGGGAKKKEAAFSWSTVSSLNVRLEKNTNQVTCTAVTTRGAALFGCNSLTDTGTLIGTLSVGATFDVSAYPYIRFYSSYDPATLACENKVIY